MYWEELTAGEFERAREVSKSTCVIPMGVIEKHGQHLPLATDMIIAREVASRAAKIEPVTIFPYYCFGQISEAKQVPGTIALSPELQTKLLSEVCDEIARNGFKKIVFLNAHGGNPFFLKYFIQGSLHTKRDYALFYLDVFPDQSEMKQIKKIIGTEDLGDHGGSFETAQVMATRPDLVKMDCIESEGLVNYGKLNHMKEIYTGIWWYAEHPTHFAGDPSMANAEKGYVVMNIISKRCADAFHKIKNDDMVLRLLDEYYSKF